MKGHPCEICKAPKAERLIRVVSIRPDGRRRSSGPWACRKCAAWVLTQFRVEASSAPYATGKPVPEGQRSLFR